MHALPHQRVSRCRRQLAGEHAERGRLAGAVNAQQPEALARAHAQPQVRHRAQRPRQRALVVPLLQALRQDLSANSVFRVLGPVRGCIVSSHP